MEARFAEHLRESGLMPAGARVVVAVSGGLDSTALLHLLRFALDEGRFTLTAAHFDHRMRPRSGADADWVSGLCRAWDVPLTQGIARRELVSEGDARQARYDFLARAADARHADFIATAHHADDQAETVLFRIIRGTGLTGLAGIPSRRGRIVRPLLPFRRDDIRRYGDSVGLRYREDPTNRSRAYARNRLRHDILPRLERMAPGAAESLVNLADDARAARNARESALDAVESDVVVKYADSGGFELARDRLLSYHSSVRSHLLRRLLARLGSRPDRSGTEAILTFITTGESGGAVDVRGGVVVAREFDRIRVYRPDHDASRSPRERTLLIAEAGEGRGSTVIGGRPYRVSWSAGGQRLGGPTEGFDAAEIVFPLKIRGWRPGDRLRLAYGTKKLKKLYAERRIGRSERDSVPVLSDAEGRILWVVGVARADFASAPAEANVPAGATVLRVCISGAGHG